MTYIRLLTSFLPPHLPCTDKLKTSDTNFAKEINCINSKIIFFKSNEEIRFIMCMCKKIYIPYRQVFEAPVCLIWDFKSSATRRCVNLSTQTIWRNMKKFILSERLPKCLLSSYFHITFIPNNRFYKFIIRIVT